MSGVEIRRGRSRATRPALVALAREVGTEPEGWLITTASGAARPTSGATCARSAATPHAAVFVAEAPEGLVGRLSVARDPHPASRHVADLGLMVAASHRRHGIGRALLEAAVDWAREAGVTKLELHVFPHNEPAIALYESVRLRPARATGGGTTAAAASSWTRS